MNVRDPPSIGLATENHRLDRQAVDRAAVELVGRAALARNPRTVGVGRRYAPGPCAGYSG